MNTLQLSNTRKWLLVPAFAAFAACAQVSEAADSFGDTQNQVRAVLEGRLYLDSGRPTAMRAPARVTDIQESTRQILLGTTNSNAGVRLPDSAATATVSALFVSNTFFDQSGASTVKINGGFAASRIKFVQCGITTGNVSSGGNAVEVASTGAGAAGTTTADADGVDFINCDLYPNSTTGTSNGILVTGAQGFTVSECRISGFTNGINITSAVSAGYTKFNLFSNVIGPTNNFTTGNGTGVLINAGSNYGSYQVVDNNLSGNTVAPITDNGTVVATAQKVLTPNLGGMLSGAVAAVSAVTTFTADAVIAALTTPLPLGSLLVGRTIRVKAFVVGSAISTTMTLRGRIGTAGTTADGVAFTVALAGGATPTINGTTFEGYATVRTLGSSGVTAGSAWALNQGTTTTAADYAFNTTVTALTVVTTVANIFTVSLQASAGVGTILSCTVEVL